MDDSRVLFLDDIVLEFAKTHPNKTAIIFADQDLTYSQLEKRVNALAAGLVLGGIKPGDFVATLLNPGLDITVALLAISKVGAIYTPLDPDHPVVQIRARLEAVNAALVLTESDVRELAGELGTPYKEVGELLHQGAVSRMLVNVAERQLSDPSCIFFTSGTTGDAKGVLGSFQAQRDSIIEPAEFLGFSETDVLNSIARFAWSISMLELLAPLVVGGTSLILSRSAGLNLDVLRSNAERCTAFHCPPALLKNLAQHIEDSSNPCSGLEKIRLVWYGGDKLSIESIKSLHRVFANAQIGTAYGCTEIFGLSHCYLYSRDFQPDKVLVGKPVLNMQQLLIGSDRNSVVPGADGEIVLGGPRLAIEYWCRPDLTKEKFIECNGSRFYATGDFGRLDGNGDLEFVERRDAQVKIRGIRIELGEVEHYLHSNSLVKDAVVLAKELEAGNKELHAYIVFKNSVTGDNSVSQLREQLKAVMPDYMLPAAIHSLAKMPLTENFKIDRKALADFKAPTTQSVKISDPRAHRVAKIWEKAANVIASMESDNFFDIGGNSLSAAILAAMLSREFKQSISVADIYSLPTISAQTEMLFQMPVVQSSDAAESSDVLAAQGQKGLVFRELFEKNKESITCTRYIVRKKGFDDKRVKQALVALIRHFPTLNTPIKFVKRNILLIEAESIDEARIEVMRYAGVWSLDGIDGELLIKHAYKFDLNRGPFITAAISTLINGDEILQLTAHHIAADDNSMGRLAKAFVTLYEGLEQQKNVTLPPVIESYNVFLSDQRTRLERGDFDQKAKEVGERLLASYIESNRESLIDHIPGDGLYYEKPYSGGRHKFTEYVAALSWAFHKKFERTRFVFCAHVALQRDTDVEPRVGMFVNLVPVFVSVDPASTQSQHAQRTAIDFDEAMARSNVPFELILSNVEELRRLGRFPFDAFVNELHFGDQYAGDYRDVVVSRNFSTDAQEVSMSIIHDGSKEFIKLESPNMVGKDEILRGLSAEVNDFLLALNS